ncbi:MAG: low molecular weight phosphotyrosine protein phosphatase [Chlamydiales bacterium]|nr:low molecular weight phosphotyrosine protein phosphatase [Chlamydiales bacterium]NCF70743.1 low molecular weight phosphotyrosine protein phosphatase [Chlamydiales bacterium]
MSLKKILFVCLGNICRSPAAEGILKHLTSSSKNYYVESRGTSAFHKGSAPSENMLKASAKHHITLDSFSQAFEDVDYENYDYIFAADNSVLDHLTKSELGKKHISKIMLYTAFSEKYHMQEIPDPYYGTEQDYNDTFDMLLEVVRDIKRELDTA